MSEWQPIETAYYILDSENRPVACDLHRWSKWFEAAERHVADTMVGEFRVSTVFLGIDHRFLDDGPPLIFETMVFKPPSSEDLECHRYSSWDDAMAGHEATVERLKRREKDD